MFRKAVCFTVIFSPINCVINDATIDIPEWNYGVYEYSEWSSILSELENVPELSACVAKKYILGQ